jgi:hypothetical protein
MSLPAGASTCRWRCPPGRGRRRSCRTPRTGSTPAAGAGSARPASLRLRRRLRSMIEYVFDLIERSF